MLLESPQTALISDTTVFTLNCGRSCRQHAGVDVERDESAQRSPVAQRVASVFSEVPLPDSNQVSARRARKPLNRSWPVGFVGSGSGGARLAQGDLIGAVHYPPCRKPWAVTFRCLLRARVHRGATPDTSLVVWQPTLSWEVAFARSNAVSVTPFRFTSPEWRSARRPKPESSSYGSFSQHHPVGAPLEWTTCLPQVVCVTGRRPQKMFSRAFGSAAPTLDNGVSPSGRERRWWPYRTVTTDSAARPLYGVQPHRCARGQLPIGELAGRADFDRHTDSRQAPRRDAVTTPAPPSETTCPQRWSRSCAPRMAPSKKPTPQPSAFISPCFADAAHHDCTPQTLRGPAPTKY